MPARDTILIPLISEVLEKNPGLGANQLHEAVTPLYCGKTGRTNLRRPHFFKYLRLMIDNGRVEELGSNKRGKQVELYLTETGKKLYHQQNFELSNILSKSMFSRTKDGISQDLKALYAIILYFNEGLNYKVYTEDEAEHILRSFGLSLSSLVIRSKKSIVKYDSKEILQDIFQSPREDATVYKDVFLRSDTHERGTVRYRLFLRGITCETIIKNRDVRAFRDLGFTSKDIMSAIKSLCSLNVLRSMGSLGIKTNDEVIYKIDKSVFDFMFGLRTLNGYNLFDKMESVMNDIWSGFRPPTEAEKTWLYFVYSNREADQLSPADQLIINTHDSRNKITNGESMKSYISKIRRNDKEKLLEINKKIDRINKEINEIKDHMTWIQDSYKTTINKHKTLINNILEIVYPEFFAAVSLDRFESN
jgi:hypothetical protein